LLNVSGEQRAEIYLKLIIIYVISLLSHPFQLSGSFLTSFPPTNSSSTMSSREYHSPYPTIPLPPSSLVSYLFSNVNNVPDDKPIFIDAITGEREPSTSLSTVPNA
jgi:hypothetical protein